MINAEYRELDKRKLVISDLELSARLGKVCKHTDPDVYRVYEAVMQTAEPRYVAARVKFSYPTEHSVDLGFATVESQGLCKCLSGATEGYIVVCTLGHELDRLISRLCLSSRAEAFIFDATSSALAEAAIELCERELVGDMPHTKRFSPGYGDFSLEHQGALLDYIESARYLGVGLTDGGLMTPLKTVSAVIGILPPV